MICLAIFLSKKTTSDIMFVANLFSNVANTSFLRKLSISYIDIECGKSIKTVLLPKDFKECNATKSQLCNIDNKLYLIFFDGNYLFSVQVELSFTATKR